MAPGDHYLTYSFPNTLDANHVTTAMWNDNNRAKAKRKRYTKTIKIHVTPKQGTGTSLDTTSKQFGDLVASDATFAIRNQNRGLHHLVNQRR